MEAAPLIAFDEHAATTVAAVLFPGQQLQQRQRGAPVPVIAHAWLRVGRFDAVSGSADVERRILGISMR